MKKFLGEFDVLIAHLFWRTEQIQAALEAYFKKHGETAPVNVKNNT